MAKITTNNDLRVGMILTCKNGSMYVVVADDNGHHDVINLSSGCSNGLEVGTGKIAVCGGGSKDGRDVVKVQEFAATPTRNRLSEALKVMTGRRFTEVLTTVWEAESAEVRAAKEALAKAEADAALAAQKLADAQRKLARAR